MHRSIGKHLLKNRGESAINAYFLDYVSNFNKIGSLVLRKKTKGGEERKDKKENKAKQKEMS